MEVQRFSLVPLGSIFQARKLSGFPREMLIWLRQPPPVDDHQQADPAPGQRLLHPGPEVVEPALAALHPGLLHPGQSNGEQVGQTG